MYVEKIQADHGGSYYVLCTLAELSSEKDARQFKILHTLVYDTPMAYREGYKSVIKSSQE